MIKEISCFPPRLSDNISSFTKSESCGYHKLCEMAGMKYDLRRVEDVFYDVKIRGLASDGESTGMELLTRVRTQKMDKLMKTNDPVD